MSTTEFRKYTKNLPSFNAFLDSITLHGEVAQTGINLNITALNKRLQTLYNVAYKSKIANFTQFKRRFLTGLYNLYKGTKIMPHAIVTTIHTFDQESNEMVSTFRVIRQGDTFKNGDGAMAAILGMDCEDVIKVCEEIVQTSGRVVSAVNFNAPGQVVIAGHSDAVEQAVSLAKNTGAKKAVKLAVSVPSHCSLMDSAAEKLAKKLQSVNIERPVIPVINNVHVTIENETDSIRDSLVKQLSRPVRWVETINKMVAEGTDQIVECGPGKVLTGLNKRINRQLPSHPMFDAATIDKVFEELS